MKKILFLSLLCLIIFIFILIALLGNISHSHNPTKNTLPAPTPVPVNGVPPQYSSFNTPIPLSPAAYSAMQAQLPISDNFTTSTNIPISYTIIHSDYDANTVIHVTLSNINFQVKPNNPSCSATMQKFSNTASDIEYWCDYEYNKRNFQETAKHIYASELLNGIKPANLTIIWSDRAPFEQLAQQWATEIL